MSVQTSPSYLPDGYAVPSLFSRATYALANVGIGYLIYRALKSPNKNPAWESSPSSSSSTATGKQQQQQQRKSYRDSAGSPLSLLAITLLRTGLMYVIGTQALLALNVGTIFPSPPTTASVLQEARHRLLQAPPPPPPAGYPALNPMLFTWNGVSGAVLAIIAASALGRLHVYSVLGRDFTFRLSRPSRLVTTGWFRYMQHPSYTTALLSIGLAVFWYMRLDGFLGVTVAPLVLSPATADALNRAWNTVVPLAMVTATSLIIGKRVLSEEQMLKAEYGKQWEDWHRKTARFIPFLF